MPEGMNETKTKSAKRRPPSVIQRFRSLTPVRVRIARSRETERSRRYQSS
jgi:hypothetical protein